MLCDAPFNCHHLLIGVRFVLSKQEHKALFNNIEELYVVLRRFFIKLGRQFQLHETVEFDRRQQKPMGITLNCEDGTQDVEIAEIAEGQEIFVRLKNYTCCVINSSHRQSAHIDICAFIPLLGERHRV